MEYEGVQGGTMEYEREVPPVQEGGGTGVREGVQERGRGSQDSWLTPSQQVSHARYSASNERGAGCMA